MNDVKKKNKKTFVLFCSDKRQGNCPKCVNDLAQKKIVKQTNEQTNKKPVFRSATDDIQQNR